MTFEFTVHANEQMVIRNISKDLVLEILATPDEILIQGDKKIYQSVNITNKKKYLVRVIVSVERNSNRIITVYRTSNIKKYYEGKI